MRSLYVHFPFCESKCHYCDFYSIGRERTQSTDPGRFAEALEREAKLASHRVHAPLQFDTVSSGEERPA